jgi:hypothetical protein
LSATDDQHRGCAFASWRLLAAAVLDAGVVVLLFLLVVVCAITAMVVPLAALAHSGPAFALMGLLMGGAYFTWFGGLAGRTFGEQAFDIEGKNPARAAITLAGIARGACLAATDDARFIQGLGVWMGTLARQRFSVRTAQQPEPLP